MRKNVFSKLPLPKEKENLLTNLKYVAQFTASENWFESLSLRSKTYKEDQLDWKRWFGIVDKSVFLIEVPLRNKKPVMELTFIKADKVQCLDHLLPALGLSNKNLTWIASREN